LLRTPERKDREKGRKEKIHAVKFGGDEVKTRFPETAKKRGPKGAVGGGNLTDDQYIKIKGGGKEKKGEKMKKSTEPCYT